MATEFFCDWDSFGETVEKSSAMFSLETFVDAVIIIAIVVVGIITAVVAAAAALAIFTVIPVFDVHLLLPIPLLLTSKLFLFFFFVFFLFPDDMYSGLVVARPWTNIVSLSIFRSIFNNWFPWGIKGKNKNKIMKIEHTKIKIKQRK